MADLKRAVKKLVEEFKEADAWAKSEEDVQASYTLKLLEALGWSGKYWKINTGQEVKTGKYPDILLRDDAGRTVLVIESKSAETRDKLDGYYGAGKAKKKFTEQLFEYCRGEGKYWGILTNFVEWRLYSVYREVLYLEKKFAFHELLWDNASCDRYVDLLSEEGLTFLSKLERGALCAVGGRFSKDPVYYPPEDEIRKEFFVKLKEWRKKLKNFLRKKYGKSKSEKEIDLSTQKIIDRLIFIEVCTDKAVLPQDILKAVTETRGSVYAAVKHEFRRMDELFNAGLFAYDWVDEIAVDDRVITPIVKGVSAVDFTTLSVHVIGEVYEDYLGEIQERRKTGVYYTPAYVVDYIVKNTVGELLSKAKTVDDIKNVRVLDPACGSGSFLIRAFDEFEAAYRRVLGVNEQEYLFGFDYKKDILYENLFGVDIDPRAVEIAKLNLLIKALEGTRHRDLKGRRLLPDLSLNVRAGNSLVGGEVLRDEDPRRRDIFYEKYKKDTNALLRLRCKFRTAKNDEEKAALFEEIEITEKIINLDLNECVKAFLEDPEGVSAFNYKVAFPEVLSDAGGFDAVIGNPPYLRGESLTEWKPFFKEGYESHAGNADQYVYFIERALYLTRRSGRFSYVVSNKWMRARYGANLRRFVKRYQVEQLLDFGELPVFPDAATFPLIVVIVKKPPRKKPLYAPIKKLPPEEAQKDSTWLEDEVKAVSYKLEDAALGDEGFTLVRAEVSAILEKMKAVGVALGEYVGGKIYRGILTGFNKAFVIDLETRGQLIEDDARSADIIKPVIVGNDVRQYYVDFKERYLILTKIGIPIKEYPAVFEHLRRYQKQLEKRWDQGKHWWELRACDFYGEFEKPKIVFPDIAKESRFALDANRIYVEATAYILPVEDLYLLGLLNSKLVWEWFKRKCYVLGDPDKKGRIRLKTQWVKEIPIKRIDPNKTEENGLRVQIIELVKDMLELNKTPENRAIKRPEIAAINYKIDALVYELYGLTEEEIRIVEGS